MKRPHSQRIVIAGAGITGAYLWRLLKTSGITADIFDIGPSTRCGASPCAWGTSRGFGDLVESTGLNPQNYLLRRIDHIFMDDVKLAADLMTIDKPRLIRDLLEGASVQERAPELTAYDRLIDATGTARFYLPDIEKDFLLECVQYRFRGDGEAQNRICLGGIGYAWSFPLHKNEYHIGCGLSQGDPKGRLKDLGWLAPSRSTDAERAVCCCRASIRLSGPHASQPFVIGGGQSDFSVWGVGEAIGCVAPLAGDGIVPGMKTVRMLLAHWNDPEAYTSAVLNEFVWMLPERSVVDKLREGRRLGISDAWVLKRNSRRMGMKVGIRQAYRLMGKLG